MSVTCPQGHESDEADYCSVCGALIEASPIVVAHTDTAAPVMAPPAPTPVQGTEPCPRCQAVRIGDDPFCESCGYDFLNPPADAEPTEPEPTAPLDDERITRCAVVSADRDQYDRNAPDDIVFPSGFADRVVVLDRDCLRIGRRSEARNAHPEIDLAGPPEDSGVSRVHAALNRQGDGSYAIVDLGSSNGTTVNDEPDRLVEGTTRRLHHGDRIHLGAWTMITILRDPEPD
jgi:hypothetical protein